MVVKRELLDFEKLLEPYKEGGSERQPVERTLGSIASKLIIVYRLPIQIVGAAILKVFYAMAYKGLKFEGNKKYGSKGKELFSCIKAQAIDMVQKESANMVIQEINKATFCIDMECKKRTKFTISKKWWQRKKKINGTS